MSASFSFDIEKRLEHTFGRVGVMHTPHGDIQTPAFSLAATKGTVKALTPDHIHALGAQAILANTYHLYLEPGEQVVRDAGGIGQFMGWDGPTMTDSGGFQVFSLGSAMETKLNKFITESERRAYESQVQEKANTQQKEERFAHVSENGVTFRSHRDGSKHLFTPEISIEVQHMLGADIMFAFDELSSPTDTHEHQKEALDRTFRWAERCLEYHKKKSDGGEQALFGIIQGGSFEDLRREAAKTIGALSFDGFGIGGSYTKEEIMSILQWSVEELPEDKPRHLLGIGSEPKDFFVGIEYGADTLDCVTPTRMARNGTLYTKKGKMNIYNTRFQTDLSPIDTACDCYTCSRFTRSYLAHLFRANEMLAGTLATIHNARFVVKLVADIRQSILEDRYTQFKEEMLTSYYTTDRTE